MALATGDPVANISEIVPYGTTAGATPDSRAGHLVWDFDASYTEYLYVDGVMLGWDDSTSVVVHFPWMSSSATSGTVRWQIAWWLLDNAGDDVDGGWNGAAEKYVDGTAINPSGDFIYETLTFASGEINGVTNNKCFRLRFRRDITVDGDMAGDAELVANRIRVLSA